MARINYREQYALYSRYFTKVIDTYSARPIVRESFQVILSLFTISFLVVFALRPTLDTIFQLLAQVRTQQAVTVQLETKIQALVQAQNNWNQIQDRISLVDDALPVQPKPDSFLQQVEGLLVTHNLSLSAFSEENVVLSGKDLRKPEVINAGDGNPHRLDLPGTKPISFSFSVIGSHSDLMGFLHDLEMLRTIVRIDSFSESLGSSNEKNKIVLKVSGVVPYFDLNSLNKK